MIEKHLQVSATRAVDLTSSGNENGRAQAGAASQVQMLSSSGVELAPWRFSPMNRVPLWASRQPLVHLEVALFFVPGDMIGQWKCCGILSGINNRRHEQHIDVS